MRGLGRAAAMLLGLSASMAVAGEAFKNFNRTEGNHRFRRHGTKRYARFTQEDRNKATAAKKRAKREKIMRKLRRRA